MEKWITVNDMYNYAVENSLDLLSTFDADFWTDYKTNHAIYDKAFKRLYKNFRYFDQDIFDEDLNVADVTTDFIDEVKNHLTLNKKKYDELYRVASLSDSDYDYMSNVALKEVIAGTGSENGTFVSGSRSDTTATTEGARVDTREEQVSAFNETTYTNANKTTDNKGAESDSETFNKGEQTDTNNTSRSDNRTIERKGNTFASQSDMIKKHMELWDKYKFYEYIFNQIARELLLV